MNKYEYEAVIKALELNKGDNNTRLNRHDSFSYYWNNFKISYSLNNKIAEIHGEIPLEVSKKIYENYPNLRNVISTTVTMSDVNPVDVATSKEFEHCNKIIREILKDDNGKINEVIAAKKALLIETNMNDFYNYNYYASTKEGFLILLAELQNYYLKKIIPSSKDFSQEPEKLQMLFQNLTQKLISRYNPYFTTLDFVLNNPTCKKLYESFFKIRLNETDKELNDSITYFDQVTNPFSTNGNKMHGPKEYADKLSLDFNFNNDNGSMYIRSSEDKTLISVHKNPLELRYCLNFPDENSNIRIIHEIGLEKEFDSKGKNNIYISNLPLDNSSKVDYFRIEYDMINDIYKENGIITEKPTDIQKIKIIEYMKRGNEAAKKLTVDNMTMQMGPTLVKGL